MTHWLVAIPVVLAGVAGLWLAARPAASPPLPVPVPAQVVVTAPGSSSLPAQHRLASPIVTSESKPFTAVPPDVAAQLAVLPEEPLVAPVLHLEAEPAEGEVDPGDEPLVPPVHVMEGRDQAKRLEAVSDQPLIPRTITLP